LISWFPFFTVAIAFDFRLVCIVRQTIQSAKFGTKDVNHESHDTTETPSLKSNFCIFQASDLFIGFFFFQSTPASIIGEQAGGV
jgi:hypothetical protein